VKFKLKGVISAIKVNIVGKILTNKSYCKKKVSKTYTVLNALQRLNNGISEVDK